MAVRAPLRIPDLNDFPTPPPTDTPGSNPFEWIYQNITKGSPVDTAIQQGKKKGIGAAFANDEGNGFLQQIFHGPLGRLLLDPTFGDLINDPQARMDYAAQLGSGYGHGVGEGAQGLDKGIHGETTPPTLTELREQNLLKHFLDQVPYDPDHPTDPNNWRTNKANSFDEGQMKPLGWTPPVIADPRNPFLKGVSSLDSFNQDLHRNLYRELLNGMSQTIHNSPEGARNVSRVELHKTLGPATGADYTPSTGVSQVSVGPNIHNVNWLLRSALPHELDHALDAGAYQGAARQVGDPSGGRSFRDMALFLGLLSQKLGAIGDVPELSGRPTKIKDQGLLDKISSYPPEQQVGMMELLGLSKKLRKASEDMPYNRRSYGYDTIKSVEPAERFPTMNEPTRKDLAKGKDYSGYNKGVYGSLKRDFERLVRGESMDTMEVLTPDILNFMVNPRVRP